VTSVLQPLLSRGLDGEPTAKEPGVYREAGSLFSAQEELWDELDFAGAEPAPRFVLEETTPEAARGGTDRTVCLR
jgi:hypothetical protein